MIRKAATEIIVPTQQHRANLLGTAGFVMVAWIGSLVWGTLAFFSWLVS